MQSLMEVMELIILSPAKDDVQVFVIKVKWD